MFKNVQKCVTKHFEHFEQNVLQNISYVKISFDFLIGRRFNALITLQSAEIVKFESPSHKDVE